MKYLLQLISLLFLLLLGMISCFSSGTTDSGGSGSEIVGNVEDDSSSVRFQGWPVIGGKIFIFSSNYEANTSIPYPQYIPKTLTDSSGNFKIDSVKIGTYFIEANNNKGEAVTRKVSITTNDDTYNVGKLLVKKVSTLACTVHNQLPINEKFTYTVFILGTRIYTKGDETNLTLTLGDIPYGTYTVRFKFTWKGIDYVHDKPNIAFLPNSITGLSHIFDGSRPTKRL